MKKRAMKKWIPVSIYCDHCKWWRRIWWDTSKAIERTDGDYSMYANPALAKKEFEWMYNHPYKHKKDECQFVDYCTDDCSQCKEMVSKCEYLNYIEYGQYPLGDGCKVCGIRDYWDDRSKG